MAKDDEKYRWDWASQTFPTIDPHSKIKHQIIDESTFRLTLMS